jgi:hypothetical protein
MQFAIHSCVATNTSLSHERLIWIRKPIVGSLLFSVGHCCSTHYPEGIFILDTSANVFSRCEVLRVIASLCV